MKLQPILPWNRHFWLWAVMFVVLFLACSVAKDLRTPMWTDELLTLYMAQQAGAPEIVKATIEGSDGAPPLYAMIVSAILPVVGHQAVAVRLPATLGYCAMVICLLAFCRRRLPPTYSMAAALLACGACQRYSTEGRGYGVVLGCAAGALLCWQAAVEGRRRILVIPLLGLCLALMIAMHYYSVFFLVPLFLAEIVRWRTSRNPRSPDFGVLAALAPALLVLGLHYPLIAASQPFQKHFWSPAEWGSIPAFYSAYFTNMLIACVPALGVLAMISTRPDDRRPKRPSLTLPEWVAAGALSIMPLCVIVLSRYTTHAFVPRYALWAVPGFAVLVVALLCWAARGRAAVGVTLLGLLMALAAFGEVSDLRERPKLRIGEAVRLALAALPGGTEPIVVADIHVFMELSYYAERPIRERLIYAINRDLELRYIGSDTGSLVLSALSHRTPLRIIACDAVLAAHPRFVVAALPRNYLPSHLAKAGYRVLPIGSSIPPLLYEVQSPER